ncbi:MAG: hypothetical protein R3E50_03475 [Halioglobus sp.]
MRRDARTEAAAAAAKMARIAHRSCSSRSSSSVIVDNAGGANIRKEYQAELTINHLLVLGRRSQKRIRVHIRRWLHRRVHTEQELTEIIDLEAAISRGGD